MRSPLRPRPCFVLVAAALAAAPRASARDAPCRTAHHSEADFLVGRWTVESIVFAPSGTADTTVAESTVEPVVGGCALLERWRGTMGGEPLEALSLWTYEAEAGEWVVSTVDTGHGNLVHMRGGWSAGSLVVLHREQRAARVLVDRLTITPGGAGFDWLLEASGDGGATWRAVWRMRYAPG